MTIACGLTWDNASSPMQIKKNRFQVDVSANIQKIGARYLNKNQCTTITSILDISVQHLRKQLEDLKLLRPDWDGYGAPAISNKAIKNSKFVLSYIKPELCSRVQLMPNEWGGVQIRFNAKNGRVCCDCGDESMSYFVEHKDSRIEWYSYKSYEESNVAIFAESLISVR